MSAISANRSIAAVAALASLSFGATSAGILNVSAVSGARAASARFEVSAGNLVVTLTNTAAADALVPVDILTGVFFDISGSALALTRVSAVLAPGSTVLFGSTDPGGVVGGEWAYLGGLSGAPHGASYGISSSGLGLFGAGDVFPGSDLDPPGSPDGINYGITTAGDNPATGNAAVTGASPLIKNSVVFTLSGLPGGFDPMSVIGNVSFQYGTALDEPNIPAPGAIGLFALAGAAGLRRRRG